MRTGLMLLAIVGSLVALAVVALWLVVGPPVAILVLAMSALGAGTFFATGIGIDWMGARGRTFFDKDRR
jgi:hypothetical protein